MSTIGKVVLAVAVIVGLGVGGASVVAADQGIDDPVECENTDSGTEFTVPRDTAETIDDRDHIDCDFRGPR